MLQCVKKHWVAIFKMMEVDHLMQVHVHRLLELNRKYRKKLNSAITESDLKDWVSSAYHLILGIHIKGKYNYNVEERIVALKVKDCFHWYFYLLYQLHQLCETLNHQEILKELTCIVGTNKTAGQNTGELRHLCVLSVINMSASMILLDNTLLFQGLNVSWRRYRRKWMSAYFGSF